MEALEPFDRRNIPSLLESASRRWAGKTALFLEDEAYSFGMLKRRVDQTAHQLRRLGICPGDHVALMCSTRSESIFCWLGLAIIGAITVPVNTALKGFQLSYLLNHSETTFLIAESAFLKQFAAVEADLTTLRSLIGIGIGEENAGLTALEVTPLEAPDVELVGTPAAPVEPNQPASILYTGGTTGPSKGVVCSHSHYYWWGVLMARALNIGESDVWFTCLPFFHINAQATLLGTISAGAACALSRRFSASRYWGQAGRSGATVCSLLGAMAQILFDRGPAPTRSGLRTVFCPGISAALQPLFEERFGVEVVNAYGSTELNCVTVSVPGGSPAGSMGKPVEEFRARIVDRQDRETPSGEPGQLVVRPLEPFSVMSEYFRMPRETDLAWRNGWFQTGDRAYRDEKGNFFFVDRIKDCIRRRGENISSFEIEHVINGHPDIEESSAFPVPSELGEDEVMLVVIPRQGGPAISPRGLALWCRERLADFAVPRFIEVVSELPKTPVGRVQKFKLRARGVTPATWDREAQEERSD